MQVTELLENSLISIKKLFVLFFILILTTSLSNKWQNQSHAATRCACITSMILCFREIICFLSFYLSYNGTHTVQFITAATTTTNPLEENGRNRHSNWRFSASLPLMTVVVVIVICRCCPCFSFRSSVGRSVG